MKKNYKKLFAYLEPPEPPVGLFDKIILAIKQEQELRQSKKLLFSFLFLLVVSLIATPFSWTLLFHQLENSESLYFISAAISDFKTFLALWQDFGLAILESFPITGLTAFSLSIGVALFTLRLFLYKKRLLFTHLKRSFA